MKVSTENLGNCRLALNIEAAPSELDRSLEQAYRHLVNKVSIPGFRKGKAPRAILVQHIGKASLLKEALDHLIPELYRQALESERVESIDKPEIEIIQIEPLVFKAIVSLKPEVKLGDYRSIRLEPDPVVKITEQEIMATMERFRERQGAWVPVDRCVEWGDLITMNVEASVEGKPWLNFRGLAYEVNKDACSPVPGFASHLPGIEKNKEKTFSLLVPDNYPASEIRGKEGIFKVTVTEIKEKQLPELNDELARSLGYDSLADMKKRVADDLRALAQARNRIQLKRKALDALVEISEVNYPPVLEDREIDGLLKDEALRMGFREVADYLKRIGKKEEEAKQALRPIAKKQVTQSLVLGKLAEEEGIEISSSEVDNRISQIMADSGGDKEKAAQLFSQPHVRQSIEQSLRTEKTIDRLLQIAFPTCQDRENPTRGDDGNDISSDNSYGNGNQRSG